MKASCARDFRRGVSLSLAYMIAKYDSKKNSRFRFFLRKTRISCFSACNYFVIAVNLAELRHINLCSLRNVAFRFTAQRTTVIFLWTDFFCFVFSIFSLLRIIFISHAKIAPLLQNLRARYVLTQVFVRKKCRIGANSHSMRHILRCPYSALGCRARNARYSRYQHWGQRL